MASVKLYGGSEARFAFSGKPYGGCGERSDGSGKPPGVSGKSFCGSGNRPGKGEGRDGARTGSCEKFRAESAGGARASEGAAELPGDFAAACREIERMLPDGAARRAFAWLAAAGVADRRRCLVLAVRESVFRDCAAGMRRGEAMHRAARRFGASGSFVSKCMYVYRDVNL